MFGEVSRTQIGRFEGCVTIGGLYLDGTINGYSLHFELTTQEAMALLQLLYVRRNTLYWGLHGNNPYMSTTAPCPACNTSCDLVMTATGYAAGCRECGNDFEFDMAGVLVRSYYERM